MDDHARMDDLQSKLQSILSDLAVNRPAQEIMNALRGLESACPEASPQRAAFLLARGIASNRLQLSDDALGDLNEANDAFAAQSDISNQIVAHQEISRVYAWRGEGREAAYAIIDALALDPAGATEAFKRSVLLAGELQFEIGHLAHAKMLFERGLDPRGVALPSHIRLSYQIKLVQILLLLGETSGAKDLFENIDLSSATERLRHLAAIADVRILMRNGELDKAEQSRATLPDNKFESNDFEQFELYELDAEMMATKGHMSEALALIRKVVARYAEDQLGGREILARLQEAEFATALNLKDDASRTRFAALRRANALGLSGYADKIRESLTRQGQLHIADDPGPTTLAAVPLASHRFVRRRPIGEGGFGTVSRAYDLESGVEVALKQLSLPNIYDNRLREQRIDGARREVNSTARLQHPGIGRVYGLLMNENGEGLLVRELIEGPTLREIMQSNPSLKAKFAILTELVHAISAIHSADIVHRDLKPENVVLRNGAHPVVIDFGTSTIGSDHQEGYSANYAAPEQMAEGKVGPSADIYAFATLAFEFLVGHRPERSPSGFLASLFAGRRVRRNMSALATAGVQRPYADLLKRALANRPRFRPKTILVFSQVPESD